jgi:hypothetical protein
MVSSGKMLAVYISTANIHLEIQKAEEHRAYKQEKPTLTGWLFKVFR